MKEKTAYIFVLVLLCVAAVFSVSLRHGRRESLRRSFADFPVRINEWSGRDVEVPQDVITLLHVDDYLNRLYARGPNQVSLYIGYYQSQRAGETIHSPKNCLPSNGFEVIESRFAKLNIPSAGKVIDVNHYIVQKEQTSMFTLYWYNAHGRDYASEYKGKFLLVLDSIRTGYSDGAFIRIIAPVTSDNPSAEAMASDFAREIYPLLKDYLPQ